MSIFHNIIVVLEAYSLIRLEQSPVQSRAGFPERGNFLGKRQSSIGSLVCQKVSSLGSKHSNKRPNLNVYNWFIEDGRGWYSIESWMPLGLHSPGLLITGNYAVTNIELQLASSFKNDQVCRSVHPGVSYRHQRILTIFSDPILCNAAMWPLSSYRVLLRRPCLSTKTLTGFHRVKKWYT